MTIIAVLNLVLSAMDADTEVPMLQTNLRKKAGHKLKQYVAAISVSLGALCAGTALAWTSPALAQLEVGNLTSLNATEGFKVTDKEGATIGGMLAIGALCSAIPAGYFADKFGRKKIVLALSIAFLINWILIVSAKSATVLIIARFFAGLGTGGICVTAPMYIGEIAEASIRGILSSFFQIFLCIGILTTCIIGSVTTWTVLSIVLAFTPLAFGISFLFMPETPVYLVKTGKILDAEKTLKGLRGDGYDVSTELSTIQHEIEESSKKSAKLKDVFSSKANRRAFLSAFGVLAFQQLCGINAVVFYTVPIFKAAGSSLSPDVAGIIIAFVQFGASYLSIFIIEKANRKFFLMLSSTGMLLFLAALGMYFHLKMLNVDIGSIAFIPIASAVLFMASFSIGYGPVPWMLMGELFSPEVKGVASGFAILGNWLCAFLVTFFFPIINATSGPHVTYYILAGISGVATVFVHFVVPETRGKSLAEIQELLNR